MSRSFEVPHVDGITEGIRMDSETWQVFFKRKHEPIKIVYMDNNEIRALLLRYGLPENDIERIIGLDK